MCIRDSYLRSLGATHMEKSVSDRNQETDNKVNNEPKVCSIIDPDCDACQ